MFSLKRMKSASVVAFALVAYVVTIGVDAQAPVEWDAAPVGGEVIQADAQPPMMAPMEAPMGATAPAPIGGAMTETTVVDVAVATPRFSTLVVALSATPDILDTLETPGPWTVFAPSNDAINTFLTENGLTAEQLLQSPGLGDILRKHVVAGKLTAELALQAVADGPISLETLNGPIDARLVDGALYVGGAQVIETDIMADNGVIHVIDRVIQ
jgi:uncharacterized surface protein with fasciclin (FAS1) repeats